MRWNSILDFGDSHPWRMPTAGQSLGELLVEAFDTVVWPRGSIARKQTVSFELKGWQPGGGNAGMTLGATKFLLHQAQELAANRDQQPVYIEWDATAMPNAALNASDLHDGWYIIDSFQPDYTNYVVSGMVTCRLTVTLVAAAAPRSVQLAYMGGALASNFSGTALNLIALPVGSTALESSFSRQGAEGAIPCILSPVASPEPFVLPSISSGNLWRGGVHVYDTISTSAFAVPAGASIQTLFRSLGTDATGTLNAWAGTASIASNVVTLTASNAIQTGHADWWDSTFSIRFNCAATAIIRIKSRFVDGNNHIFAQVPIGASQTFEIDQMAAGVQTNLGLTSVTTTAGTWYWLTLQVSGNTVTCTLNNDSAGSKGSQIATITGTATSAAPQTGFIQIQSFTATTSLGGAFANVCQVTGPTPAGWTATGDWTHNEPAFCWSKNAPYAGIYSLSIYQAFGFNSGTSPYWASPPLTYTNGLSYTVNIQTKKSGTIILASNQAGTGLFGPGDIPADGAWHSQSASGTQSPGGTYAYGLAIGGSGTGTAYFDNITIYQASTPLFGDGFEPDRNVMWVEVFGTDHDFQGDCVVSNGLQLLLLQPNSSTSNLPFAGAYLWNTALAVATWQHYADIYGHDSNDATINLRALNVVRVGAEECAVELSLGTASAGQAFIYRLRLQRGRYEVRHDLKPLSAAIATQAAIILSLPVNSKIAYNSTKVADQALAETAPAFATDYGYGAGFVNSATYPFIAGFVYQNEPGTSQPGFLSAPALYLTTGDTTSLAATATRSYGFFAIPYGVSGSFSPANLQAEGESGTLGTGWSSVADGAASGGNTAKAASGTTAGNDDIFGTAFIPAPGTYDVWFRIRVTNNGSSSAEMTCGLWDSTSSAFVASGSTTLNRNAMGTSYAWVRVATGVTPTAAHNMRFRAVTALTLTTDWFVDEAVLVPKTLTADNRGPQDLAQQFLFDRSAELIAV